MDRGPSERTLQAVPLPRRLAGLSVCDAALFRLWWPRVEASAIELHANVPVGPSAEKGLGGAGWRRERCGDALWAYRIDVAIRTAHGWWLVECKPRARHKALGQLLSYSHWWTTMHRLPSPARLVVVTTDILPEVASVYARYGVEAECVGDVEGATDRFY